MEYSEQAYQFLLKMQVNGKKNYDEERYTKSLIALANAHKALKEAIKAYEEDPTDENEEIVEDRDYDVFWEEAESECFREIMEGKRSNPKMTDTMYAIHGYKMKDECDKILEEWTQRVLGPQGFWAPGMPVKNS
jgi:hypothetical protein